MSKAGKRALRIMFARRMIFGWVTGNTEMQRLNNEVSQYDYLAQFPKHNYYIFYNRSTLLYSGYFPLHNVSLATDCIM